MSAALALVVVASLGGCGDHRPTARPPEAPASASPSDPTPSERPRLTAEQIVDHPRSQLVGARVRRTDDGFGVVSWWRLDSVGRSVREAIASSDDGFATATYERWTTEGFYGDRPPRRQPEPPADEGLLAWSLPSLVDGVSEGTRAVALGSDGATLFPFEQTARSTDGGESWSTYDVAPMDEQGYLNGGVVLNDGRLLVLLGNWSGDRPRRPSGVHHGLWVSAGDDWSRYTPWEPTYSPPLEPTEDGWYPVSSLEASAWEDVIWSIASSGLLYVSTDDGQTFTAVPAR